MIQPWLKYKLRKQQMRKYLILCWNIVFLIVFAFLEAFLYCLDRCVSECFIVHVEFKEIFQKLSCSDVSLRSLLVGFMP